MHSFFSNAVKNTDIILGSSLLQSSVDVTIFVQYMGDICLYVFYVVLAGF